MLACRWIHKCKNCTITFERGAQFCRSRLEISMTLNLTKGNQKALTSQSLAYDNFNLTQRNNVGKCCVNSGCDCKITKVNITDYSGLFTTGHSHMKENQTYLSICPNASMLSNCLRITQAYWLNRQEKLRYFIQTTFYTNALSNCKDLGWHMPWQCNSAAYGCSSSLLQKLGKKNHCHICVFEPCLRDTDCTC